MRAAALPILIVMVAALAWGGGPVTFTATRLGTLPGGNGSVAMAINNNGQVAGYVPMPGGGEAFVFGAGEMTGLRYLTGYSASYAKGINDQGQVVGIAANQSANGGLGQTFTTFTLNSTPEEAFLYSPGKGMTGLAPPTSGGFSSANAINDSGEVAGQGPNAYALLYSVAAGITYFGTFPNGNWSARCVSSTLRHPAWEFSDFLPRSFGRAEPAC